ncbi:sugar kinase [Streptococcus uberis]|uniref:sugar kinase n=1 Tax=Streptococcus uberis TaxID=1349 RepID=UPI00193A651F|nr:sugar kinase [Streptococcus uberis]
MTDIITIGEPLVVLASENLNKNLIDTSEFSKILGGAELNVMIGASRLGHSTEYITQVGDDPFGQFTIKEIDNQGVGNRYIGSDPRYWTGFYLKEFTDKGDPKTFYFRKGSAASHITEKTIDQVDLNDVKWAHLSGIFPAISEQALQMFKRLLIRIRNNGIHTTFDPNLRPALWESESIMRETINELAKFGEIVMPGINEGIVLVGSDNPEVIADFYLSQSHITKIVIVKLGADGAFVKTAEGESYLVPGYRVEKVIDTVGAGDGFAVGVLTGLIEGLSLQEAVKRGCAIGALAVMTQGDNDGYPTRKQLDAFQKANIGAQYETI